MKVKDRLANKRFELDQKIVEKERTIDEMRQTFREASRFLDELEMEISRGFSEIQALNEELIAQGSYQSHWESVENQGKQHYLSQLLENERVELTKSHQSVINSLEEERSAIQKERNNLSWD
ncbi:hypothetical protein [Streptococcus cuniculi]|uniref:Uncharacterized protein n=1 Tax=Streptococcus cuniculi TaxID=1432788 RepID=A0A4Y9JBZ8_9STRE|nr:hypothetical protein [Streptococcus cuniculi]MBF0777458.1 hypothetical protein [Streptococcus cuniculi]TFU98513.1 hypothetical protein E4T82_01730 [Streptococcus cuniculi]